MKIGQHQRPHRRFIRGRRIKAGRGNVRGKYIMLLDTSGLGGGLLSSGKTYTLPSYFGDNLVKQGRAKLYSVDSAKRVVNLNGKEITWGEYMRRQYLNRPHYTSTGVAQQMRL